MTPRIFFPLSGLSFVARYFVALCSNTHNKLKFSHVLLTFQATARYCRDLQTKSNMFCIIRAPSQTQSQRIVIHLARSADKGGGVLMSIILPNLNHSFISPVPVPDPDFRIFHTPHTSCNVTSYGGAGGKLNTLPRALWQEKLISLIYWNWKTHPLI